MEILRGVRVELDVGYTFEFYSIREIVALNWLTDCFLLSTTLS